MTIELHPLCTLFPRMSGADFKALCADILANGLRLPIVMHDGMILDGGNRYRACLEVDVAPTFTDFNGDNLVSFVLSSNLHRRHMTAGQQAAIVSSAQDWAKAQTVGKPKSGNATGLATVALRAAQSGASDKTQRVADKVAKADPALAKKVGLGEVSLPKAEAAVDAKAGKKPAAKPAAKKATKKAPEAPAPKPDDFAIENLQGAFDAVQAENDELKQRLAVESMQVTEEDKTLANDLITELRKQVASLTAELKGVKAMRDSLLVENGALKRQCESLVRKTRALAA